MFFSLVADFYLSILIVLLFQIVKNHNFVTMDQLEEDKEIVELANKSLSYRNQLQGEEHEVGTNKQLLHSFCLICPIGLFVLFVCVCVCLSVCLSVWLAGWLVCLFTHWFVSFVCIFCSLRKH